MPQHLRSWTNSFYPTSGKGAGKKRKTTEDENGEDEAQTPPPAAKKTKAAGGKRGKKAKDAEAEVKAEESEGNELS